MQEDTYQRQAGSEAVECIGGTSEKIDDCHHARLCQRRQLGDMELEAESVLQKRRMMRLLSNACMLRSQLKTIDDLRVTSSNMKVVESAMQEKSQSTIILTLCEVDK